MIAEVAPSDRDPYVRNFAAVSLGRLNAKVAIGALWGAVKDPDSLVRLAAAEALVKLGEGEAALVMRELLRDPDFCVRSAAVGTMARSGRRLSRSRRSTTPLHGFAWRRSRRWGGSEARRPFRT